MTPRSIRPHSMSAPGARDVAAGSSKRPSVLLGVVALGLALLWQSALWLNPGWFSHDELQWGSFASGPRLGDLPWPDWLDWTVFQYRPLTFTLWLFASHFLFDAPRLFHFVFVLLGTGNAVLLALWVKREWGGVAALWAAAAFLASPFVIGVHGWVATLADVLWVGCLLVLLLCLQRLRGVTSTMLVSAALTLLGLLAKEAALAIPALLAVVWCWQRWDRRVGLALVASSTVAGLYLFARLAAIQTGSEGSTYGWSLGEVPHRLLEYAWFPWAPGELEPVDLLSRMTRRKILWASVGSLALVVPLLALGWRRALCFAAAGVAALGPTLVLKVSFSQYGYGLAAVVAVAMAYCLTQAGPWSRRMAALSLLMMAVHGQTVALRIHELGVKQQRFHDSLLAHLYDADEPLRLRLADVDRWFFVRLTHQVPSYRDVPLEGRFVIVDDDAMATHRVENDGSVIRQGR